MTPMTPIVLTQAHTHAGQAHKAGQRLDVDASSAAWLIQNGIARHDRAQPQGEGSSPKPITTTHRKESK